jgi:hypothetical protein
MLPGCAIASLRAQVTFINVDELAARPSTNAIATRAQSPPLNVQVAVVRFLPANAARPVPDFTNAASLHAVVAALSKQGQVNLLCSGHRLAAGGTNTTVAFDPDEDTPAGINLRTLFGKKAEPAPKPAVPDISFLSAEDRECPLTGQRAVKPGELIVAATSTSLDPKQPEFIYVLLRFEEAN